MGGIKVTERDYTMNELRKAVKEKRVYEMFGAGTAVIVIPVDTILYECNGQSEKLQVPMMDSEKSIMQKVYKTIQGIQYGQISRPQWTVEI
ncbi:unnamed protein product [Cylicostephanus goldi]|uniref:Branched-chain amino acid aminotransferase n=1 Tax=Cylicostephanus goldi TaxID=71465 RepID=A0A3P6RBF2_CYLGO|nr:unnamed protein product [Cylicostephanus goldi]